MAARVPTGMRLAASARARLGLVDEPRPVDLATPPVARDVADRLARTVAGPRILAGDVLALGLLDEVLRTVISRYLEQVDGAAFEHALDAVRGSVGDRPASATLGAHALAFPPPPLGGGDSLRELLLTALAAANPALGALQPLVDDTPLVLAPDARYGPVIAAVRRHFASGPRFGPDDQDLVTLLEAPARAAPDSLTRQLVFVRDRWSGWLGSAAADLLDRLLIGLGVIAEEAAGLGRWGAGPPGPAVGGLGALIGPGLGDGAHDLDAEPERFSSDVAWMPELVLIAKSTHVWLDQLSRTFGRAIRTLDAIPDEELDRLARLGVTGLWLIGLWERSRASREIKRRRGNPDALASAYALDDYAIALDLGGDGALRALRERAWRRGIRLASDMVPNHMGIDSRWVIEHPEWFLQLPAPPFPAYRYEGPDLSSDSRVAIVLEDHYWDDSDAAVVFKRADRWTGDERYIYHGNDGTSFPWNDTAQLDYLRADVREAVIQTILHVARQFPVIRFDAAMVLAKRHIERLWYPLPGAGGAIPSRAEHALTKRAFDAAIPTEFWREVVDRVAAEAPGTLLLAEAFWLMEGYFVRTLGMHRVYNSAFMVLLRDEDNATYRRVMRDTLEFDPQILGRFVNFMSNPDEKTAVEQFGTGDKHFAVATLMATMPGLPMLGHGQLEGFRERYGMEFSRAAWDEPIDEGLLARYEREIVPLLRRRGWFAGSRDFLLYDATGDDGAVREDVFAYSNVGPGGEHSLVVVHNRHADTAARIRESSAYAATDPRTGERGLRRRTLGDGTGLAAASFGASFVRVREARSGLEHLWPIDEILGAGLRLDLGPYDYRVYLDWRAVVDGTDGRWRRLASSLGGRGVPSLDGALRDLELEPVHDALAHLLGCPAAERLAAARRFVAAVRGATGARPGASEAEVADVVEAIVTGLATVEAVDAGTAAPKSGRRRAPATPASGPARASARDALTAALRAQAVVAAVGALGSGDPLATATAWFVELRLGPALDRSFAAAGIDDPAGAVHRAWLMLRLAVAGRGPGRSARRDASSLASAWLADQDIRAGLGVHDADGVTWLRAEGLAELASWARAQATLEAGPAVGGPANEAGASVRLIDRLTTSAATAGYRVDRWLGALDAERTATGRPRAGGSARVTKGASKAGGATRVTRAAAPGPKGVRTSRTPRGRTGDGDRR